MKKLLPLLTLCLICACCAFGFSACESENGKPYFGTYKDLNTGDKIIINDKGFIFGDVAYDYEVYDNYIRLTNYSGNTKKWYFHENCNVISPEVTFNFDMGYIPTRNGNFQATLTTLNNNLTATSVFYFALDGKYQLVFPSSPTLSEAGSYTLRNGLLTLTGNKQLSHQTTITRYYIDENYQIHVFAYINDINKFYNTENTDTPAEPTTPETHIHNFTDKVIAPTCTAGGYTLHECSCGEKYTDTYTSALNHNYVSSIISPTCTEQGYTTYMCTRCFDIYRDNETPALGHNFVENGLPVGCCALSFKQNYMCTRCNKTDEQSVTGQAPDTHNHLNMGETCEYCGWSVYNKNGDSVLMKNSEDKLSAEFYGTETYDFGYSIKPYYINTYISNNVINIVSDTFDCCNGLTSIKIPDSVINIGSQAFMACYNITSITIPDSVISIGRSAFSGIGSYHNLIIETENGLNYIQNVLIGVADTNGLPPTQYTIRNGTRIIAGDAFFGESSITKINIPDSVISIGEQAFSGCSNLTNITIPDSIINIGEWAFSECSNLTNITIPDSVTSIGDYAFYNCSSLTSITIPNSVKSIKDYAFCGCSSLTNLIFNGTKSQWNSINKHNTWNWYIPSTCTVHCTDGDINI